MSQGDIFLLTFAKIMASEEDFGSNLTHYCEKVWGLPLILS